MILPSTKVIGTHFLRCSDQFAGKLMVLTNIPARLIPLGFGVDLAVSL